MHELNGRLTSAALCARGPRTLVFFKINFSYRERTSPSLFIPHTNYIHIQPRSIDHTRQQKERVKISTPAGTYTFSCQETLHTLFIFIFVRSFAIVRKLTFV